MASTYHSYLPDIYQPNYNLSAWFNSSRLCTDTYGIVVRSLGSDFYYAQADVNLHGPRVHRFPLRPAHFYGSAASE